MSLKLVPFNANWITHNKLDLHAIYRRPRFVEDGYGELHRDVNADGQPTWDLTGDLPVRSHTKWEGKGFEYVTLANRQSLVSAGRAGTIEGDWRQYDQHQTGGPWNYRKYAEGQAVTTTLDAERLKADVLKYGWEAVEDIRRQREPNFRVPEHMKAKAADKAEPAADAGGEAAKGKQRKTEAA